MHIAQEQRNLIGLYLLDPASKACGRYPESGEHPLCPEILTGFR